MTPKQSHNAAKAFSDTANDLFPRLDRICRIYERRLHRFQADPKCRDLSARIYAISKELEIQVQRAITESLLHADRQKLPSDKVA